MHIVLTGGGTAGHVVPNLAIADAISAATSRHVAQRSVPKKKPQRSVPKEKVNITYIGSRKGVESELVTLYNKTHKSKIDFHCVATGKFRRYFSLQNFFDLFRIPFGIVQAYFKLGRLTGSNGSNGSKPDVIFSKGGFVGFPVVVAGWLRRIPIIIHESDAIPGLATKLTAPFAQKILLGYEEAAFELKKHKKEKKAPAKIQFVGNPVRKELFTGCRKRARRLTGFTGKKPVLLVMGGSSGAQQLNEIVAAEKSRLTEIFDVVHITGKGKGSRKKSKSTKQAQSTEQVHSYFAVPYLHEELRDVYKLASMAISRAGANSLAELEAIRMPTLLYPLGRHQSRGDQMANTQAMCRKHTFFLLADEGKEAHTQLLLLPKRKSAKEKHCKEGAGGGARNRITSIILEIASLQNH